MQQNRSKPLHNNRQKQNLTDVITDIYQDSTADAHPHLMDYVCGPQLD